MSMHTNPNHVPPTFRADGFNCPKCGAFAEQGWGQLQFFAGPVSLGVNSMYWSSRCARCRSLSLWVNQELVFPSARMIPEANTDMPAHIIADYEEAALILQASPRGAAALLRLSIQKLCAHLGLPGKNINDDIASLVKQGLPPKVQKALDIVRVVGNSAVHPGQLDVSDDRETAVRLFGLVNLIAEVLISQPKHVDELFDSVVPEGQKKAIAKRDG